MDAVAGWVAAVGIIKKVFKCFLKKWLKELEILNYLEFKSTVMNWIN